MSEFDGYKDIYEKEIDKALRFSGKSHDFFTKIKAENLVRLFDAKLGGDRPLRILDVGCGVGSIHPFLMERRPQLQLCGIDVAGDVIEDARRSQPYASYDVYNGDTLPYPDQSFDAAYTICVMHHVPPPQWARFVAEMRRVVRPGGLVIAIEHNPLNPLTRHIVNNCPLDKNAVLIRSEKLTGLMRESGLDDVQRQYFQFTPFDGKVFRSMERALKDIPLGAQYIAFGKQPQDRH